MTTPVKVVVGIAVLALLGVVVYAYAQQQQPGPTMTGSALPPVLTPATGAAAPRARSTGSGPTIDTNGQVKGSSSGTLTRGSNTNTGRG